MLENTSRVLITILAGILILVMAAWASSEAMKSPPEVETKASVDLNASNPLVRAPAERTYSIVVNTTDDEENHDGDCSLREAISAANLDISVDACSPGQGTDDIFVPAGVYHVATAAPLDIRSDLALIGAGSGESIIQVHGSMNAGLIKSAFSITDVDFSVSSIRINPGLGTSRSSNLN